MSVQLFILGIVDFLSQSEGLQMQEFQAVLDRTLERYDLDDYPPENLCAVVPQWVERYPELERVIRFGAQSIQMYVAEHDSQAPIDIGQVVVLAQSNPEKLGGSNGPAA